ncbi:glycosyltransferase family 4 protein [Sphingopyxis sp.]|jgi:glycosyltransferase involved in cell wall biosynthesis|uniref:glycosyltransferase family 4 protein n=1 Tax=Sphingopyxis sp. TaxID=1908224 RepID=UPI003F708964
MRIAYFINSMNGGGAESPLPRIVFALEKAGAEVGVFALTRGGGRAIPWLRRAGIEPVIREGGEKDHIAALRWIEERARGWDAEIIWTSLTRATLLGQIVGKRLNIPVVSWQHNSFLKPWNERLLRWRAKASDIWIADSGSVAEFAQAKLKIAPHSLVTWPIFAVTPNAPQARAWRESEMIRIGSLGRLERAKGYDILIDALVLLRDRGFVPPVPFHIKIGGVGSCEEELKSRMQAAGINNLDFSGFINDPASFLSEQHIYLQPSRYEGFCIATHEAIQAGLPVIVSQAGEMPLTVNSDNFGRTVPVGDVETLADALVDLLSKPAILYEMGQSARARILERFSQDRFDVVAAHIVDRCKRLQAGSPSAPMAQIEG